MGKRTTIYDIAARLGISTATVNRALTGKPRVKEETRQLVLKTAEEMGFKPNTLARSLASRPLRFAAVGFTSFPEFHDAFLRGVQDASDELIDFNVAVKCFDFNRGPSDTPEALAYLDATLRGIAEDGYDGVLVLGCMTPAFRDLRERRVCVATVVNDIEDAALRSFTVCCRARVAGRMAAELISRMMPDRRRPVAIASGDQEMVNHRETEQGFREQMAHTPLNLARVIYNRDNASLAYDNTAALLREVPELGAVYVNSFNCSGVIHALRDAGRIGDVLIVTSDLSAEISRYIEEGTVVASIFQNQYEQGRLCLHKMYDLLANGASVQDSVAIDPQIILYSNLTLYKNRR